MNQSGGVSTKTIPPQGLNLTLKGGNGKIDCTFTGITSEWLYLGQYYRLIAKPGGAPTSPTDGIAVDVVVGSVGSATISASITGLVNGVQYYVRLYVRGENGWQTSVDAVGTATPVAGIALSTIAASDATTEQILMIPENGTPIKFILLKHGYESSGRSLVLRKDAYNGISWNTIDRQNNAYANSNIDTWLNGAYIDLIGDSVKNEISEVSIRYTVGNGSGTVTSMNRKAFVLSGTEVGVSASYMKVEGTAIPYFGSNERRIAYEGESAKYWWLRSPYTYGTTGVYCISSSGTQDTNSCTKAYRARPAFTLSADMLFNPNPNADGSYSPLTA